MASSSLCWSVIRVSSSWASLSSSAARLFYFLYNESVGIKDCKRLMREWERLALVSASLASLVLIDFCREVQQIYGIISVMQGEIGFLLTIIHSSSRLIESAIWLALIRTSSLRWPYPAIPCSSAVPACTTEIARLLTLRFLLSSLPFCGFCLLLVKMN